VDGAGLRCFRHYPNNGTRKGWAAGDAASRWRLPDVARHVLRCHLTPRIWSLEFRIHVRCHLTRYTRVQHASDDVAGNVWPGPTSRGVWIALTTMRGEMGQGLTLVRFPLNLSRF
jgi:2-methylcitrate dehydratase PrpD